MLRRMLSVSLLAVAMGACGGGDDNGRRAAPAIAGVDATVSIVDMSFSPAATNIRVGDAVAWTWDDGRIDHDVVFGGGPASPRQRSGTWQFTFDRPGTYEYVCSLHPTSHHAPALLKDAPMSRG